LELVFVYKGFCLGLKKYLKMFKHTHKHMVTKTITIVEEAYTALAREKLPNESFSDTIKRITKQTSNLEEFFGCISEEDADAITKNISEQREHDAKRDVWRNTK
jgi:predicted CopG family antitoxin